MPTCAQELATFASELTFSSIPAAVVRRAKDCIIDTVAACTYGAQFPWSGMVADYAQRYGSGGPCSIFGFPDRRVHAPYAALSNGVLAHAFEQDSVRDPGIGGHPGAALVPAILAACQETGASGEKAITAFVAACEVMFRVGGASHHSKTSPEQLGFHAPGLTGPYGAAIAAGLVFGLDAEKLAHALGIAGSLSSGLLAFTKSRSGAMVKRLHLGRASESGILAARLASAGYTGPETVLEGKFGYLDAYCREGDPKLLTAELNQRWETLRICIKRYACHMRGQIPVQALREMMTEHGILAADVKKIMLEGSEKVLSHHNIPEPGDLMQAQYSVPFCVSLALFRDPEDPQSFAKDALNDPSIRTMCRGIEMRAHTYKAPTDKSTRIIVQLKDGREFRRDGESYKGMPDDPLSPVELRRKFLLLTAAMGDAAAAQLHEQLEQLEARSSFPVA